MRHRPSPGALIVVVSLAGGLLMPAPASMQGRGGGRPGIQTVNGHEAVANEILVRFRDPIPALDIPGLRDQADAEAIDAIGSTGVLRLRSRSMGAGSLAAFFSQRGDVLYAEPNYIVRALTNDASFPQLWGLENIGQSVNGGAPGRVGSDIRAVPAWDVSVGAATRVVAVIDTGIDYTHEDLAQNIWSAPTAFTVDLGGGPKVRCSEGTHGFNAITRKCEPMDDNGHGTHVAGTIGAVGNNGIGVVGVNWTTQLMGVKFLDANGSGSMADAVEAIRFVIETKRALQGGADVRILSASWGGFAFSQALFDEISAAQAEDMLFVAAAGNSGLSNDFFPTYPASYDVPNIVAVAATTNTDDRAWFSNYGASVDLGAPGVDILSTTPGNSYAFSSGTSMATPHVSGAAALVLSVCSLDTAGLKDALLGTVQPVQSLASVTATGGRLDVNSAMHSCIAPPPAPSDLLAIGGDGQVTLSWSAALGATAYSVKRSLTAGGPYTTIAADVKTARYVDAGLVNGTTYYYVVSAKNMLGESPDSSEASATPNLPSDLVVPTLVAPTAAGAGAPITVSVTTTNQGIGPAAPSVTAIYLSADWALGANDQKLEPVHTVPALGPGESTSASLSLTIPSDTPTGQWILIAAADADAVVSESQESNNTRFRSLTVGPDLIVSAFTVPSSAAAGAAISVSETVKNQGGGTAGESVTQYYLSVDVLVDGNDTLLSGARAVPTLEAGASSSGGTTVTIPATTPVGQYYLIAKADGGSAVAESFETNNTLARLISVGADLVVSALSSPAKGGAGLPITVTDTTTNQGSGVAGPSVTRFYLSADFLFDASDTEVGGRSVPELAGGASSSGSTTFTIPATVGTGVYYVLARANADGTVTETQSGNNFVSRAIYLGPDQVVSLLTVPATAAPGSSILVSDTTVNQGGGAIGATTTRYYFSANSVLDAQDLALGGRAVPGLAAGASHTGSASVTIPSSVPSGTSYIIARADGDDAAIETLETNNLYVRTILIGGDMVVSALTVPAKGGAGSTIVVSDTTVNQGTAAVAASVTRFYLSANSTLDAADPSLGDRAIPALAAGASSSGSATLTIPAATGAGSYYVIAKADADNTIAEMQEGNNLALRGIQIGPDLIVSALTAPTKAEAGSTINVSDTTTNQGAGAASASATEFYLSADWILGNGDVALNGSRAVGPLLSGASSAGTTAVAIPVGTAPGAYYLFASGDAANVVAESLETNNTRYQVTFVGPDLAVSSASFAPSTIQAGSSDTVTDTVVNQGAGLAAPSTIRFYLSVNWSLDASDILLASSRTVPALGTNMASSGATLVTIPASTPPGAYWVLAKADADGVVPESQEANNVRLVRSIQVTAP